MLPHFKNILGSWKRFSLGYIPQTGTPVIMAQATALLQDQLRGVSGMTCEASLQPTPRQSMHLNLDSLLLQVEYIQGGN